MNCKTNWCELLTNHHFITAIKAIFMELDDFDRRSDHKTETDMLGFGCYNEGWENDAKNADWCKDYKVDNYVIMVNWCSIEESGVFVDYEHSHSFHIIDSETEEMILVEYDACSNAFSICG